jgi:hypothetical protein
MRGADAGEENVDGGDDELFDFLLGRHRT